ncbi:MAG TPA: rhodanese-like domain-containing protein [Terriglobales bacterium]|nr:rhodanese-like domain-containing protein [Terriglobales bacterium]
MSFTADDIQANRDYFAHKLHAEKQRSDVLKAVESGSLDFLLVDTRGREAFDFGHITGAWCAAPGDELDQLASRLPKDKDIVTYCWGHD